MIQKLKRIVLDNDTFAGRAFDFGVQLLIVVSLITYSIETLPDLAEGTRKLLFGIECGTVFAFTIAYLLRIYFSQPRLKFMLSFFGLIDLAAILPFYLATGADFRSIRAFRLMRLFRLLKLARYNAAIRRFHRALLIAKEEVILFLCTTIILLWLSAIGIYHFENEAQPEKFKSVFHSLARHRGFAARLRPMDCSSCAWRHPVESQSRRPAAKVYRILAKTGVELGMISLAHSSCQQCPSDLFNKYGINAIQA